MDSLSTTADRDDDLRRMLQLPGGLGLEAHGGTAGSQRAPELDVGAQDTKLTVVSQGLDLAVDDHGVEDAGLARKTHRGVEKGCFRWHNGCAINRLGHTRRKQP